MTPEEVAVELDVPEALRKQFPAPHFDWFAYPHGDHNAEIVSAVCRRFEGAVSCIAGNDHDKYQLNRLTVTETTRLKSTTVSIIIANYNYGSYLPEAVDSVLTQTLSPDEIILIDDASTDGSSSIAKRYADRIRVVLNDTNLGIVGCFNKAVSMASGDYIAILGADNRMRADYVERCKSALDREPNVAVAYTDMIIFGSRSSILASAVGATEIGTSVAERWPVFHWKFPEPTPEVLGKLDKENFIHGSSMYRRGVFVEVGGYMDDHGPEDHNLFKRMIAAGWGVFHVPYALIEYRQHSTSQANTVLNLQIELAHLRTQAVMINQTVADRDQRISELTRQLANRDQQIVDIFSSYSWKVTAPLRKGKELTILFLPKLKHFIKILLAEVKRYYYTLPVSWQLNMKRYAKAGLRLIKQGYQALPFSIETKSKHRQWIAKLSPRILTATGSHPGTLPAYTSPLLQSPLARSALANPKTLVIPSSENPVISIIIPIYGKIDYTIRCIASISLNPPNTAFEIIVVDDCSPDDSYNTLSEVNGIRLIRNAQNQGFIRSCNNGARQAIGKYLLFLNNDTEIFPNWADELLRTFYEFPGTGLAGSKLVYPNGLLQEAGGIIWQDGSAWNFGRCQDPTQPVYNYAREVDYCSGASIMIPKDLFNELGGFDELYTPAYCEDSDLALKIRDKGYRVIYQPLSVVIHYEGITSGTDLTQGAKAYQVVNTQKQFERWNNRLKLHQAPGQHVDQAKDRTATRRVLFIDHCTPTPNKDSGSIDAYNHMLLLREMGFQVTFIPEDNFFYMPEYTPALQRVGVEMLYAPTVTSVEQHVKEYGSRYDLVFLNRLAVFEHHIKIIRRYCTKAKVLFHTVDLHFLRVAREAALHQTSSLTQRAEDIKQREINAILTADIATVISTEELELLKPLLAKDVIRLLPYSRQLGDMTTGFQGRKDLVFVGSYQHAPNVDAVKYFAETVMPLLRKQLPQVRFYAVGSTPPPEIQALASDDIIITGFIENLTPLLDKMRLSVAPLRYGAGIKGKIGSAMSVGLPVVATTIAIEGMGLTDGENVVVVDTPQAIADAISLLYHDEIRWNHISQNSQFFAEKHWGAVAAWQILADIVTELGVPVTRNTYPLSLYSEFLAMPTPMPNTALLPVGSAHDQQQYQELLKHSTIKDHQDIAQQYLAQIDSEMFTVNGFCVPCNRNVSLLVDAQFGGQHLTTGWLPNWRERLECPLCKMNNRQRLIATLIHQALANTAGKSLYFMEQVTPIYQWAVTTFPQHQVIGSEYLGHQYSSGSTINGIRHEDVENLSFANEKFDFIISNDVFEHVPHPAQAFAECARVLKPQGIMLASIPFHVDQRTSVNRAQLLDKGRLAYHLPPMYHGNPISAEGSLVFTDFGWDILNTLKDAGFSDATIDMYSAPEYGHLGDVQLIFKATKLNN